ncbi:phage tail tube protein [Cronobacter dublinensis]|uniref:phage tail tube protein n=1 Tax=Cronobacter TaxID=413496 RepID=UPI000CFCD983|nr:MULTISPECIES: phage tail tube protein [Cronobacter]EGT5710603.1 phage tail protein [Cronobacter dublinensis subsp. dublinensis]EGT5735417.1 phage tail protein [Cronobacter dublinensis subsp. dublinensis]EKK4080285.1 Ig-like domain-containing protein [Cronobacter dublinensis]EKM6457549.1 Ig-like domain-containing protein [Cronobacter dublinensis]EKP4478374.1 Ig-like domain-containing protein [Cronobacter dublinensis]
MGFQLPNGSTIQVGSEFADEIKVTAVSNAKGAVFSCEEGHGLAVGDEVMISSGWPLINYLPARVSAVADNDVTIGIIDSSDENFFPPGNGIGTLRKVTAWTLIPQITELSQSGGDQQYIQIQFLEDDRQRNIATYKAAKTQTITLAHDSSLPIYEVLKKADRRGDTMPLKMYVPKATETRYWSGTPSFDPQPQTAVNAVETVQVSIAVKSMDMAFYKDQDTSSPKPDPVAVTGVTLDNKTLSLAPGGKAQLKANVTPENATDKSVEWSSSDEAVTSVDASGNVTAAADAAESATATITATTTDGGFTDSCEVTITAAK